jgi:hypothetical protein
MTHEDDLIEPPAEERGATWRVPTTPVDAGWPRATSHMTETEGDARPKRLGSSRGVETLFRSMYRVHMDLTAVADNKANIMITVNGLILSILLASVGPRLANDRWLLLPTSIALLSSLAAIVFAVLAAKPRLLRSVLTSENAVSDKSNPLFFGNYTRLDEAEFVGMMSELIQDRDAMYHSMMRDIYEIGLVLNRKFMFLQRSYGVFVVGISVSVASFVWVFTISP